MQKVWTEMVTEQERKVGQASEAVEGHKMC